MSVLLLRWWGWWGRVVGAPQRSRLNGRTSCPIACPPPVAERSEEYAVLASPTAAAVVETAPADADAVAFIAGLQEFPETNTRPPFALAKDPLRARTLAGLEDLREIPALQLLTHEFVQKLS